MASHAHGSAAGAAQASRRSARIVNLPSQTPTVYIALQDSDEDAEDGQDAVLVQPPIQAQAHLQVQPQHSTQGQVLPPAAGPVQAPVPPTVQTPYQGRQRTTVPRPAQYTVFTAQLSSNLDIRAVQHDRWWRPDCPGKTFPYKMKLFYLYLIYNAFFNFTDVYAYEGPFQRGECSIKEVEYACHLVWVSFLQLLQ